MSNRSTKKIKATKENDHPKEHLLAGFGRQGFNLNLNGALQAVSAYQLIFGLPNAFLVVQDHPRKI